MQAAESRANELPAPAPAPATPEVATAPASEDNAEESSTRRSSRVAETSAESVQASVTCGLLRWLPRNSPGTVQPAPATGKRMQQPFTEAEKVCMAWAWRYRRAHLMGVAPDAAPQNNSGNESSAPS